MTPPRHWRSDFEIVCALNTDGHRLQEEEPLFAADRGFAHRVGGPITRAFLETLPDEEVIIDSSLVWLVEGLCHDTAVARAGRPGAVRRPPPFRHEPYPGVLDGVRGACNRAQGRKHRLCVLGTGPAPVVAWGQVELGPQEDPEAFWSPQDIYRRDARIRQWLDEGRLTARALPMGTVVQTGWGSLLCPRPARAAGFQLTLRATWGSALPVVNGLRNTSFL
jgi:hypothetical protein